MNFGMIFLCLLIGCIIGFEAGKYVVTRKVSEFMNGVADQLRKTADVMKKKAEDEEAAKKERREKLYKLINEVTEKAKEARDEKRVMSGQEHNEDISNEKGDK